jgi:hypothetical protein
VSCFKKLGSIFAYGIELSVSQTKKSLHVWVWLEYPCVAHASSRGYSWYLRCANEVLSALIHSPVNTSSAVNDQLSNMI